MPAITIRDLCAYCNGTRRLVLNQDYINVPAKIIPCPHCERKIGNDYSTRPPDQVLPPRKSGRWLKLFGL